MNGYARLALLHESAPGLWIAQIVTDERNADCIVLGTAFAEDEDTAVQRAMIDAGVTKVIDDLPPIWTQINEWEERFMRKKDPDSLESVLGRLCDEMSMCAHQMSRRRVIDIYHPPVVRAMGRAARG